MTTQTFLKELQDVLQRDEPLTADYRLADDESWDSMSQMAVLAFFAKHFGIAVSLEDITMATSVKDLIELAADHIND